MLLVKLHSLVPLPDYIAVLVWSDIVALGHFCTPDEAPGEGRLCTPASELAGIAAVAPAFKSSLCSKFQIGTVPKLNGEYWVARTCPRGQREPGRVITQPSLPILAKYCSAP